MIAARAADAPVLTTVDDVDTTALEELYRTHARRIYSLAYRFVGNAADAEELLQDIFLHAHRRLASFKQRSALSTWLHRLAVNRGLDYVRSRAARQIARTASLESEAAPPPRARARSSTG